MDELEQIKECCIVRIINEVRTLSEELIVIERGIRHIEVKIPNGSIALKAQTNKFIKYRYPHLTVTYTRS